MCTKSPKVYHQQTIRGENVLKKEIELLKNNIQKLKKEIVDKDYYIIQMKRGIEADKNKE